jgi:hypothetical protein
MLLKKALTTTVLATVLLTSSISANDELATQDFSGSTQKIESIGAFDNIPTQGITKDELNTVGEGLFSYKNIKIAIKYLKKIGKEVTLGAITDYIYEQIRPNYAY